MVKQIIGIYITLWKSETQFITFREKLYHETKKMLLYWAQRLLIQLQYNAGFFFGKEAMFSFDSRTTSFSSIQIYIGIYLYIYSFHVELCTFEGMYLDVLITAYCVKYLISVCPTRAKVHKVTICDLAMISSIIRRDNAVRARSNIRFVFTVALFMAYWDANAHPQANLHCADSFVLEPGAGNVLIIPRIPHAMP